MLVGSASCASSTGTVPTNTSGRKIRASSSPHVTRLLRDAHCSIPAAWAQQAPPQYGAPGVTLEQARKAIEAAEAEAKKNGWLMAIAVVSERRPPRPFTKMDQTQYASIKIAQHKARTAATFRRPTKAFQDGLAANPANIYLLTLDDVIASEVICFLRFHFMVFIIHDFLSFSIAVGIYILKFYRVFLMHRFRFP